MLETIRAKIMSYIGQFLQSEQQLIDYRREIDSALQAAQSTGSVKLGERTWSLGELTALAAENDALRERNAALRQEYLDWQEKYDALTNAAGSIMPDTGINPDMYPYYGDEPGIQGIGAIPVMVPAGVLVAAGAALATGIFVFLGQVKSHIKPLGEAALNVAWLIAIGLGAYVYLTRGRK